MTDTAPPTLFAGPSSPPVQPQIAMSAEQVAALAPEQRASLLNTYRKAGYVQSEMDRVFGAEAKPAPRMTAEQEARVHYDASFAPGSDPAAYDLAGAYADRFSAVDLGDFQAFDTELRAGLAAMQIPRALGKPIVDAMLDSVAQRPEGPALSAWQEDQKRIATRVAGGTLEEVVANAAHALSKMSADTRQMLLEHGALDGAAAIVMLAQHGARLKSQVK